MILPLISVLVAATFQTPPTLPSAESVEGKTVSVVGSVKKAGVYPIQEGATVGKVAMDAGPIEPPGQLLRIYIVRPGVSKLCIARPDTLLEAGDVVQINWVVVRRAQPCESPLFRTAD